MNWNRTKYKYTSGKELHSISNLKWGYAIEKIVRIKILEPFRKNRDTEAYCGVSEDSQQKHFAATYQLRVAEKKRVHEISFSKRRRAHVAVYAIAEWYSKDHQ